MVLFAVPRLIAALAGSESPAPLGGEHWRTSRVMLPQSVRDRTFRHALTGAEIRPTRHNDSAWIFLGEIFQHVPVGILITNH